MLKTKYMLKRRITIATAQRRTLQKEVGPQGMAVELYHAHQAKYKIASFIYEAENGFVEVESKAYTRLRRERGIG